MMRFCTVVYSWFLFCCVSQSSAALSTIPGWLAGRHHCRHAYVPSGYGQGPDGRYSQRNVGVLLFKMSLSSSFVNIPFVIVIAVFMPTTTAALLA